MKRAAADLVSSINVTPLVDVCLVLLIIFMVITPLMVTVPVDLPESITATPRPEHQTQLAVVVKSDGSLLVGSVVLRLEQLQAELERRHKLQPNAEVVVQADRSVKYGSLMEVLRQCREAGFQDIGIIARRPTSGEPGTAANAA